jgi:hypothetical protein
VRWDESAGALGVDVSVTINEPDPGTYLGAAPGGG